MAAPITTPMTAEEFFDWANRPEQADRKWELEDGVPVEAAEVPPSGELHGTIRWLVSLVLGNYLLRRGTGYICTNDTGLVVRRGPDAGRGPEVMLFLTGKTVDQLNRGSADAVPQLVVEVFSPSDRPGKLTRRIAQYLRRGIPLVWVVYPEGRTVDAHRPGAAPDNLAEADELAAPDVLPDFCCRVADLFALPGQSPAAA